MTRAIAAEGFVDAGPGVQLGCRRVGNGEETALVLLDQLLEPVCKSAHSVLPRIDAGLPGSFNNVPVLVTFSPSTRSTEMSSSMKLPT